MIADVDAAQLSLVAAWAERVLPATARAELAPLVAAAADRSEGFWRGYTIQAAKGLLGARA